MSFTQVQKLVLKDLPQESFVKRLGLEWLSKQVGQRILKSQRDTVFLHWITVFFLAIFSTVSLLLYTFYFCSTLYFILASIVYLATVVVLLGRFIIAMHVCVHSPILKQPYTMFNNFIFSWLLSPYFGLGPETYYCHHMHHVEGNMEEDLSSTMNYCRYKLSHFLHYFATFYFLSGFQLLDYFHRKDRMEYFFRTLLGEGCFLMAGWYLTLCVSWQLGLVMFILPYNITRFGMMSGNWIQHAFIDPSDPNNEYKNSITVIDTAYNKDCFNDGYHANHHLHPMLHWSEMPQTFLDKHLEFKKNKAIVFRNLDYLQLWYILVVKNDFEYAAKHLMLYYIDENMSIKEAAQYIKNKMEPVKVIISKKEEAAKPIQ